MLAFHRFQSIIKPETIEFTYLISFVSIEITADRIGWILFGCAPPQVLFYYFSQKVIAKFENVGISSISIGHRTWNDWLISFVSIEIAANRMGWIFFGCAPPQVLFSYFSQKIIDKFENVSISSISIGHRTWNNQIWLFNAVQIDRKYCDSNGMDFVWLRSSSSAVPPLLSQKKFEIFYFDSFSSIQ